jgi:ABC-type multidrug transport system fused ATPase/permease subunit
MVPTGIPYEAWTAQHYPERDAMRCTDAEKHYQSITSIYKKRSEAFAVFRNKHSKSASRISALRLVVFLSGLVAVFWLPGTYPLWTLVVPTVIFPAFAMLVLYHKSVSKKVERYGGLERLNTEAIARMNRDWSRMPNKSLPGADAVPDRAVDLDLVGNASLYRLLGSANTPSGKTTLLNWLFTSAASEEIIERQAAVRNLSAELDFRQELELQGVLMNKVPDTESFLAWAIGPRWLMQTGWLRFLSRLSPVLLILNVLIVSVFTPANGSVFVALAMLCVVVNIALTFKCSPEIHRIFRKVSASEREFASYADILKLLSEKRFNTSRLEDLKAELSSNSVSAYRQMGKLDRILQLAELRFSGMLYFPVQFITLWDIHALFLLERWQKRCGPFCEKWLNVVGEMEALSALASLKYDNPGWVFPEVVGDGNRTISVEAMGHPLMLPAKCVTNDLQIGPPGNFILVTGSNMSGKSTLLRSLGLNVVLAQAGGPVFARKMSLPPMVLGTSFRVQDSLEKGVSFFMAELKRIKEIIDLSEAVNHTPQTLLFLLDEILLGTNSFERQVAVREVLLNLLEANAMGLISTHDLSLAQISQFEGKHKAVHFTENIGEGQEGMALHFDYKLRDGISQTVNALKLLEIVGIRRRPGPPA